MFQAEENILKRKMDHEYAAIGGLPDFCKHSIILALGEDSPQIAAGVTSTVQVNKNNIYSNKKFIKLN